MQWRYTYTVLGVAMFAQVSQQASRLAISPVVPQIIDWFGVSKGAIGLVLTGMWAAYALCQFPSGLFGDRFGERRIILVSMGLMGIGSLLLALSPSFFFLGVFAVVLGAGTGLYYSVAASLLTKLFDETGQALGIHSAAGAAAGLFIPPVAAFLGVRFGWQVAVLVGLIMAIPSIGLLLGFVRPVEQRDHAHTCEGDPEDRDSKMMERQLDFSEVVRVLLQPRVAYVTILASIGVFTWQAMQSFYPTFLVEYHGFSTQEAGGAFGLIFLFSTLSQAVTGKISDIIGRDTVIATTFIVTAAAYAGVIVSSQQILIIGLTAALGAGMSWFPVMQARIMDGFSDSGRGSLFGLVRTIYMFIGASGSLVIGTLVDSAGWMAAYGLLFVLLGIGILSLASNRIFGFGL